MLRAPKRGSEPFLGAIVRASRAVRERELCRSRPPGAGGRRARTTRTSARAFFRSQKRVGFRLDILLCFLCPPWLLSRSG